MVLLHTPKGFPQDQVKTRIPEFFVKVREVEAILNIPRGGRKPLLESSDWNTGDGPSC